VKGDKFGKIIEVRGGKRENIFEIIKEDFIYYSIPLLEPNKYIHDSVFPCNGDYFILIKIAYVLFNYVLNYYC